MDEDCNKVRDADKKRKSSSLDSPAGDSSVSKLSKLNNEDNDLTAQKSAAIKRPLTNYE